MIRNNLRVLEGERERPAFDKFDLQRHYALVRIADHASTFRPRTRTISSQPAPRPAEWPGRIPERAGGKESFCSADYAIRDSRMAFQDGFRDPP
jgi:hypothetical protein